MLSATSLPLVLFIVLFAASAGTIAWAVIAARQKRDVIRRATELSFVSTAIRREGPAPFSRIVDWIAARVPAQIGSGTVHTSSLAHAGFDGASAAATFALLRVISAVVGVVVGLALAPRDDAVLFGAVMITSVGIGLVAPTFLLDSMVRARVAKIRRGIPDALDLLVVCVEAGVALDAAMQRVARELFLVHPILADELMGMSRRIAAGMSREQALHGLYLRTGVSELRSLASHMLQSEKWGTSITTVLRLYSEQLRVQRRAAAEKRAATASTRMLIPLVIFIFPTMFVVLLGPAIIRINTLF